jgi:hypothetical protein
MSVISFQRQLLIFSLNLASEQELNNYFEVINYVKVSQLIKVLQMHPHTNVRCKQSSEINLLYV